MDPLYPPSCAVGLPEFWVPLLAGVQELATRPLFEILGAHPPNPLGGGCAPSTPFARPRGLRVFQRFGSHPWRGCRGGCSPLLRFRGGTPPTAPRQGGFAPLDPPFARPRRLRVRQCFGSHFWRVCKSWQLAPYLKFWGHIPQTPWEGAAPPPPPLPALVGLWFSSVLGPTRGGVAGVAARPLLRFRGGTPPTAPCQGAKPPGPPFARPRGLRVCRRFGPHP